VLINAAPNQICEILTNLLDNAQRYAAHSVQVQVDRTGDTATLAVSDDGAGIAKPDRERIFDRFVRLRTTPKRTGGGTGLGLAITREITKAHHGSIRAEQSSSGGARFVVRLPVAH
jgi:signal transduction histidine kinase